VVCVACVVRELDPACTRLESLKKNCRASILQQLVHKQYFIKVYGWITSLKFHNQRERETEKEREIFV
jgi:hypothetical protein